MIRRLAFVVSFLALLSAWMANPAAAQSSCDVLTPGNSCVLPITTTAATKVINVSQCGNWIAFAHESDAPASNYTVFLQGCFVDASGDTDCENLHAATLDGDAAFYYDNQGPGPSLIRGNATVTTCAAGDCKLEVACGR